MLASVLPGIRELRAPLAAGYLWLLLGWLLFEGTIPPREDAAGLLHSLLDLLDALSVVGIGVIASFVAYLLGSLTERLAPALVAIFIETRLSRRGTTALTVFVLKQIEVGGLGDADAALEKLESELKDREYLRLQSWPGRTSQLHRRYLELVGGFRDPRKLVRSDGDDDIGPLLIAELLDDLPLVRTRLLEKHMEVFSVSDRLQAEATFRFAIVPPLVALDIVAVAELGFVWLAALIPVAILLGQALIRQREAGDVLADALRLGLVEAPLFEEYVRRVAQGVPGKDEPRLEVAAAGES